MRCVEIIDILASSANLQFLSDGYLAEAQLTRRSILHTTTTRLVPYIKNHQKPQMLRQPILARSFYPSRRAARPAVYCLIEPRTDRQTSNWHLHISHFAPMPFSHINSILRGLANAPHRAEIRSAQSTYQQVGVAQGSDDVPAPLLPVE